MTSQGHTLLEFASSASAAAWWHGQSTGQRRDAWFLVLYVDCGSASEQRKAMLWAAENVLAASTVTYVVFRMRATHTETLRNGPAPTLQLQGVFGLGFHVQLLATRRLLYRRGKLVHPNTLFSSTEKIKQLATLS